MWQIYLNYHQRMGILPLNKRVNHNKCSFATKQRMFEVFALDEPCSPVCELYATLDQTTSDVLVYNVELHYKYDHSYFASIQAGLLEKNLKTHSAENRLRATDVNLHQFPFWSSLKLTQRRKSTKATNGILHLFRQVI